ncbi:MAG: methyl-accepting chemotaxis protein [Thermosynechococcaceae cyanobacterium]
MTQESLASFSSDNSAQSNVLSPKTKSGSWWKGIGQTWDNLSIRAKISILLVTGATIPVIAVTQSMVDFAKNESFISLRKILDTELTVLEDKIQIEEDTIVKASDTLALAVQTSGANLENANQQQLQSFVKNIKGKKANASFYLITDGQGKTVAQSIQAIQGDEFPLVSSSETASATQFKPVNLPTGISLKDLPIVSQALARSQHLSGFEIVPGSTLKRLGLDRQADIGLREQQTAGLPEAKQPYPETEFDIDGGKAGFVIMSVTPIKLANGNTGTAIVGTLVNRNFELVDNLKKEANVSTATIFANDWRVSTNVPYTDKSTRAIGTRVSRAVAETVLKKGETYLGNANIIGIEYETGYSPLYSHLKEIDGDQARPIGIAYVGEPQTEVNATLRRITFAGYGIGGVVLIIVTTILVFSPDRSISRPLRKLAKFASEISQGESGMRLEETDRQDEIGVLSQNLNEMAANIDANLESKKLEAEEQRREKEKLEGAIATLIDEVYDATEGDLTVRANLESMELSTVADVFNAIIDNLQEIAIEAKDSTSLVGSSLRKNEEAMRLLTEQAISEAEETRNTLVDIEQMSKSIQEVAQNASQAEKIMEDTYGTILHSTEDMDLTVDSILNLRTTVGETAKKMKRLGESSQKISQVVSFIEEIALKTNVLAINASVEAGRAGEYGQGFTIVAEQVGALAEQSAAATKEIASIVATIQSETQDVSQAMESGTTQVVESTRLVEATKQSLSLVLEKSQEINQLMGSISQANVSQAATSQNVTNLMQKIAQLSEATSKSSDEVAQSIVATAQVAEKLESTVAKFKVAAV